MIGSTRNEIYYIEIIESNVSTCMDSDVNYYYHYKIGDILEIEFDDNLIMTIRHFGNTVRSKLEHTHLHFTIDWDTTRSHTLSLNMLIKSKYAIEITKSVMRQKQIDKIIDI